MNRKYIIIAIIVVSAVGFDQWSKLMAVHYLKRPDQGCDRCYDVYRKCTKKCTHNASSRNQSLVACRKNCDQVRQHCRKHDEKNYNLCRDYYNKHTVPEWKQRVEGIKGSLNCQKVIMGTHAECVVVPGFFHYKYQINPGAAWGLLSQYPSSFRRPFFVSITIVAIFFILYVLIYRIHSSLRLMVFSLSMILGGALGNFIDRLRLDYVIDFIKWYVNVKPFALNIFGYTWNIRGGYYEWPTFNIADVAISVGVILIAIELVLSRDDLDFDERPKARNKTDQTESKDDAESVDNAEKTDKTEVESTGEVEQNAEISDDQTSPSTEEHTQKATPSLEQTTAPEGSNELETQEETPQEQDPEQESRVDTKPSEEKKS